MFLLTKAERYYFDQEAVRIPMAREWNPATNGGSWAHTENQPKGSKAGHHSGDYPVPNPSGANIRSVWSIPTESYAGAHFATYPRKLVEPCIKAGTSERGCCAECGKPWEREVERLKVPDDLRNRGNGSKMDYHTRSLGGGQKMQNFYDANPPSTLGWHPTCHHNAACVPATVLDPFAGSGTTGVVALAHKRNFVGLDLSAEYLKLASHRINRPHAKIQRPSKPEFHPLFPETP